MSKLGIIMLNWNGHEDSIECISSIRKNEEKLYTIFLLDNGSDKGSAMFIENWLQKQYGLSYIITNEDEFNNCTDFTCSTLFFIKGKQNLGFAKGNNLVWDKIKTMFDYTLLLNNDTVITKNSITNMVNYMEQNLNTGVVSCDIRLYSQPDKLWNAGGYFTWYGDRKYFKQSAIDEYKKNSVVAIKTPFITGCVLMARKDIVNTYGVFTEKFFFGEEDFNYCKRLNIEGVNIESVITSTIYHKVGSSIKKTQKNTNSFILHFSNRIINLKEFYSPLKWRLWRRLYILAIFVKVFKITRSIKQAVIVKKQIKYYTSNYNEISFETFKEINRLGK